MMVELLKRQVSLTVLKVRLVHASAGTAPTSGASVTANQALTPNQRILCELQVTGNAEERGLVAPATQASNRAPSRRKHSSRHPTYETCERDAPASPSRTLAQWNFAPEEMQLPVDYSAAARFQDNSNTAGVWLADAARFVVSKVLNETHGGILERFASSSRWLPNGKPTLPSTMLRQLQSLLPSIMRERDCLWLELAEPAGYLPLLPWEEMLRPVTAVPILRLSPHSVQALSPDHELAVLLCLTVPSEKWTPSIDHLASMATAIRRSLPTGSTIHVFADDTCHAPFAAAQDRLGSDDGERRAIKLYDSPLKSGLDKEKSDDRWWMTWITSSLKGRAIDIVHVLAPGLLFADNTRLVIARQPGPGETLTRSDRTSAPRGITLRYLLPLEFCDSLTVLGAWAAVCSAPARGSWLAESQLGLRLLVDQIARSRPGVAAFHDLAADPDCAGLAATYAFMIGDPSIAASTSPAISLYCHPARATAVPEPTSPSSELMQQYAKVKEALHATIARPGPLPAWVAATQRVVEHAMSRVAAAETADPDGPEMRGLAEALKYVEQMLAEQALSSAAQPTPVGEE
jgi:hypothetical protein